MKINTFAYLSPLLISLLLFSALTAFSIIKTDSFSYPLDDTYIHLKIADNLSKNGVLGINNNEFASTSSSILYPFILATTFLFTDNQIYVPLYINVAAAILVLIFLNHALIAFSDNQWKRTAFLALAVIVTPLPTIALLGMEHTLQILFMLIFTVLLIRLLSDGKMSTAHYAGLLIITPLFMSIRYESLFFLPAIFVLFLFKRKYSLMTIIFTLSLTPTIIFGLYSMINGGYPLPNSVLIKSLLDDREHLNPLIDLALRCIAQIYESPEIISLLIISGGLALSDHGDRKDLWTAGRVSLYLYALLSAIHLALARTGIFFRYEAYLILMGLLTVFLNLPDNRDALAARLKKLVGSGRIAPIVIMVWVVYNLSQIQPDKYALFAIMFTLSAAVSYSAIAYFYKGAKLKYVIICAAILPIVLTPLAYRGMKAAKKTHMAMTNVYEQQQQMAAFVNKYYAGKNVAVNDIGAVSYFGNAYITDLWGLGNREVLDAKANNEYNSQYIYNLAVENNINIIMVYDEWFEAYGGFSESFKKVGTWTISFNVVCGSPMVTFYAINETEENMLRSNLMEYNKLLPPTVKTEIFN